MQLLETNSPFSKEQTEDLNRILPTLTETQRIWLSGYLSVPQQSSGGVAAVLENPTASQPAVQQTASLKQRELTILYGSETGNAQSVAKDLEEKAKARDKKVKLAALDDFKPKDLKKVQDLMIVTATHGEGDPPDNAISFHEFLHSRKAPKLQDVRFSVLSLGDESYEFFCQTGKDFDKRLEELGGERLYGRVDCDVDFDEPAAEWVEGVLSELEKDDVGTGAENSSVDQLDPSLTAGQPIYSRTNPFNAEVLDNINLNGEGSNKETHHLELSLEGSNLAYEPGDSVGIFPKNDPELVESFIGQMNWDPEESVPINKQGEVRSLREALLSNFEITRITKPLLKKAADLFNNDELTAFLSPEKEEEQKTYMDGRDLLDLVKDFPPKDMEPADLIQILRKMPARLYSITSSYQANPEEVHLAIGKVSYHSNGRDRSGVCSGQCAERVEPGETLPIYIQKNENFKFPMNGETPAIMVGPGTGVAPFRSYLEELEELEVEAKTWLFFGDQHFTTDFLYQVEWQNWLKNGVLTKMDVAFSRDTKEKVYVQDQMRKNSAELYKWVQEGANIYVCGDEKKMAQDVHDTLLDIFQKEGNMSAEQANDLLKEMRQQKRYQRDVY
ncbi:assimilatory sulfite reductase (NADPH) flavoprotein subunit [Virgibacillus xinjiangensis]|uniref:Assimilatory sulfite reductase (NADPH) flavoprotein subunit n=1 Tax=Virgibacillus xinjiangensis TaxID=393090 RepID=A0ABV7CY46_9BACI